MLWTIPALFGGRTPREIAEGAPEDFNILPGLLAMMALLMFFCCQYLYWHSFAHRADNASTIAVICTLLYGVTYWSLLRALDDAGWFTKTLIVVVLAGLAAFNACIAGHELLLLAYEPQVQAQASLSVGTDTVAFASAKEKAMGLPDQQKQVSELNTQLQNAQTQMTVVPAAVSLLMQQANQCESEAGQMLRYLPHDATDPLYPSLRNAWNRKTRECQQTASQAQTQLATHQQQWKTQAGNLQTQLSAAQKQVRETKTQHAAAVKDAGPTIAAAHASGSGRYEALWQAVEAGTVPRWAAYGLMFFSCVLDTAGLVLKLLQAPDAMARQRRQEAGMARAEAKTMGYLLQQLQRGAKAAAQSASGKLQEEFNQHAQTTLTGEANINLEAQAFERIHRRTSRAQARTRQPLPSLMRQMRNVLDGMRQRMRNRYASGSEAGATS